MSLSRKSVQRKSVSVLGKTTFDHLLVITGINNYRQNITHCSAFVEIRCVCVKDTF